MNAKIIGTASAIRLIDQIVEDLLQGRSVLLVIPAERSLNEIQRAIHNTLSQRELWTEEIALSLLEGKSSGTPLANLASVLQLNPFPSSFADLVGHYDCPEILLLNCQGLQQPELEDWLLFMKRWSDQTKQLGITNRVLCVCLPANTVPNSLLSTDVRFSVRWWWRTPSALEAQLLCRLQTQERTPETTWREYLLPSLAGDDIEIVDRFWNIITESSETIIAELDKFARAKEWDKGCKEWDNLLATQVLPKISHYSASEPPAYWRCFWDVGALSYTPEYGLEIHSAALALLGREQEIEQRLWRGQAALLLPFLDSVRLNLCKQLTYSYGNTWPLLWLEPENEQERQRVKQSPLATQWGHLARALLESPYRQHLKHEVRLAAMSRKLRNELAHYRPVSFSEFCTLWQDWMQYEQTVLITT